MSGQTSGNCTYASAEAALLSFLAIRHMLNFFGDEPKNIQNFIDNQAWKDSFTFVRSSYDQWLSFDRTLVIEDFMIDIYDMMTNNAEWTKNKSGLKNLYTQLFNLVRQTAPIFNPQIAPDLNQRILEYGRYIC